MYHIIICEKTTGIVLELDRKTHFNKTNTNIRPSINFSTLEKAEGKAVSLVKNANDIEIVIYDENWSFIKLIAALPS